MLLQYALVALCLAQMLHYGHMLVRMAGARDEMREAQALLTHLDWRRSEDRRHPRNKRGWWF